MTLPIRIVVVGGGSTTFVPQLLKYLVASRSLRNSILVLTDIDRERLELMAGVAGKYVLENGSNLQVEHTVNRRKALTGADFVILTLAVGGFDLRATDLEIPARYGIFTMGAETVGPGGLMRALRQTPVLIEICLELEEVSPDAWLFSYANPTSSTLMAMEQVSDIRKVSLCTCSSIARRSDQLGRYTGLPADDLRVPAPVGGVNHCAAILELQLIDGTDALPLARQRMKKPLVQALIERYHVLPYCGGHWTEFYPGHTRLSETYQGRLQGMPLMYGRKVYDAELDRQRTQNWEAAARNWLKGGKGQESVFQSPLVDNERIEVVDIIEAIVENHNAIHVVITRNQGAIPNLPPEAIVEVSAAVGSYGIRPLSVGPLPGPIAANLRRHTAFFALVAEAALSGNRQIALEALLLDLQTSAVLTPPETDRLLQEMMTAESQFLPQFGG